MDQRKIAKDVSGKRVSYVTASENKSLAIHFTDGSVLQVQHDRGGFHLDLVSEDDSRKCPAAVQPSSRQREYLEFIRKCMDRYGRSPAESDVQRHFLVSAPSVNQMMRMLARRGFITRQPGVPRSIRLVEPETCAVCGGTHYLKVANAVGRRPGVA